MSQHPETDACYVRAGTASDHPPPHVLTAQVEELDATCRRLEEERDDLQDRIDGVSVHSCSESCKRPACTARRERDEARKELLRLADLLDAHFNRGGTVAGIGTTNKARLLANGPAHSQFHES